MFGNVTGRRRIAVALSRAGELRVLVANMGVDSSTSAAVIDNAEGETSAPAAVEPASHQGSDEFADALHDAVQTRVRALGDGYELAVFDEDLREGVCGRSGAMVFATEALITGPDKSDHELQTKVVLNTGAQIWVEFPELVELADALKESEGGQIGEAKSSRDAPDSRATMSVVQVFDLVGLCPDDFPPVGILNRLSTRAMRDHRNRRLVEETKEKLESAPAGVDFDWARLGDVRSLRDVPIAVRKWAFNSGARLFMMRAEDTLVCLCVTTHDQQDQFESWLRKNGNGEKLEAAVLKAVTLGPDSRQK